MHKRVLLQCFLCVKLNKVPIKYKLFYYKTKKYDKHNLSIHKFYVQLNLKKHFEFKSHERKPILVEIICNEN